MKFFAGQPGFLDGYMLRAHGNSGEVGRISVWENESFADQAANSDHVMALRSDLLQMVQGDHSERSFTAD
ncbi:MAG: hypothetical protein WEB00_11650 [Dehalococcoidia bacterium]